MLTKSAMYYLVENVRDEDGNPNGSWWYHGMNESVSELNELADDIERTNGYGRDKQLEIVREEDIFGEGTYE